MEREANYAAVGSFVLGAIVLATLFVYWYSEAREHRNFERYEIYFDGSVSGLTRGAPVRYLGVDVGRVVAMHVDTRSGSRVQVIVDIDGSAPVSPRTVAELSLQGITGVLYIDLLQNAAGLRVSAPSEEYPVIPSIHSNFDVIISSLPQMVASMNTAFERVGQLLDERNINAISSAFGSIDAAARSLPATLNEVRSLVVDLRRTSGEFRDTLASVHDVTRDAGPRLRAAVDHLDAVARNLDKATAGIDQVIAENRSDVRAFTREGLPELQALLRDGREAALELRELARSLKENPSQILYQPRARGVPVAP